MKKTGFFALDDLTGGLPTPGLFLVTGQAQSGKSSFALTFLERGLAEGENAVLVTDRPPSQVLEHARELGLPLDTYVERRDLLIFEYPEDIADAVQGVEDHERVLAEFEDLLGGRPVDRVVFDPLTPLASQGGRLDVKRCASVLRAFSILDSCTVAVLETSDVDPILELSRRAVSGVIALRRGFQADSARTMTLDGFAGTEMLPPLRFHVRPGEGLVSAQLPAAKPKPEPVREAPPVVQARPVTIQRHETPRVAPAPLPVRQQPEPVMLAPVVTAPHHGPAPGVLLIEPSHTRRLALRAQLERNFSVVEAQSSREAVEYSRHGRPGAIVLAETMPDMQGRDLARLLREQGSSALILGLVNDTPTAFEQLAHLAAGIDLCLTYSTDDRVLRLTILNFLERLGTIRRKDLAGETNRIARPAEEEGFACTTDLRTFCARVARETIYARENGLPLVVLTLRVPEIPQAVEELTAAASALMRLPEVVYAGPGGIACLLAEAETAAPFLGQFWNQWRGAVGPVAEELRFVNQDAFVHRVREFVRQRVGANPDRPAAAPPSSRRTAREPETNSYGSRHRGFVYQ
ncbi:MAG: ATPase domain-containing protein [Bryobacteraceae bacterium]